MAEPAVRPQRWRRLASLVGILSAGLGVAGSLVSSSGPDPSSSGSHVITFYSTHVASQSAGALLQALAFILLVFFAGVLRAQLRSTPASENLSTIALVGAGVMLVGEAVSTGISYTLANSTLTPDAAQALNVLSSGTLISTAGFFVFALGAGLAILVDGALPKWLGIMALLMALIVLTPAEFLSLLALVVWMVIVSFLIYRRSGSPSPASN